MKPSTRVGPTALHVAAVPLPQQHPGNLTAPSPLSAGAPDSAHTLTQVLSHKETWEHGFDRAFPSDARLPPLCPKWRGDDRKDINPCCKITSKLPYEQTGRMGAGPEEP